MMPTIAKKKVGFIVVRVLLITFVVGNAIAWLSGAKPIDFPKLPYAAADQTAVKQLESTPMGEMSSEHAQSLGMHYFLHNHLEEAHQILQSALNRDESNASLQALKAVNDVKRAGERLDLLFGQIKLYDLKQALHTLKLVSDALPEQLDIQLLALWAFTSVPDINDSAQNAVVIAKRIEPILNAEQSMPQALSASSWLAMARLYLHMAESADGTTPAATWQLQARNAWQHYQALKNPPIWLERESAVVAQGIAGLSDVKA
ncbi:TPA: hypothetical protein G9F27_002794 [Salmonella enterica]|uniref:Tetratricopeptide repeat protein n=1 Tax=Salmonella enterica TaxID=28901 RepID=A0A743SMT2_SALER|nr:hypothetical protein [Salmonella enterica]